MSKVITFSRMFPSYHRRKGEPTYFVEKIWSGFNEDPLKYIKEFPEILNIIDAEIMIDILPKYHTIRSGNRWKVGDKFSPAIWGMDINPKSGRSGPYHSKQIKIAPDIEIKKIWNIESTGNNYLYLNDRSLDNLEIKVIAANDGLRYQELLDWFKYPKPFKGQIICWNENINY